MSEIGEKGRSEADVPHKLRRSKSLPKKVNKTLDLAVLIPYSANPFDPYEGQRLQDMVESIRDYGVIMPIVVRRHPEEEGKYEILSGHNRVAAARKAGLEVIPAIICEGLTEEEAKLIVTETNLRQRSFSEMSHSERAITLSMHYEAIKQQGQKAALVSEIENMVDASNINSSEASGTLYQKVDSRQETGKLYDISSSTVAHYIRINKLCANLRKRLDNGEFAFHAAVTLSHLSDENQQTVGDVLDSSNYNLDMNKAEALRRAADKNKKPLEQEKVEKILAGTKKNSSTKSPIFRLKRTIIKKYFKPEQKAVEIEATIVEALEYYYARKDQENDLTHNSGDELSADDVAGETPVPESPVE